jgi:hypothetical protein
MTNLQLSQVLHRNIEQPLHVVQASDFTCTKPIIVNHDSLQKIMPIVPYALDSQSRKVIYSAKVDLLKSQESPFLYDYLRRNTDYILSVDFNYGNVHRLKNFKMPVFIFSTGRCGSTLFTQIAKNHQRPSLSEPDFYTQLATLKSQTMTGQDKIFLFNHLTADLVAAYGHSNSSNALFIKLRAECNALPQLYIRSKQQKTIFISRNFSSWAKSVLQHFNNPKINPEVVTNFYSKALRTLDFLSNNSNCIHIRYEQLLDYQNPETTQLIEKILDQPINLSKLHEIMGRDSQLGSDVEQSKKVALDQEKYEACINLFKTTQSLDLMTKYGLSIE